MNSLPLADKLDLAFRRLRKPDGSRFIYADVAGVSNSAISRLRKGHNDETSFWNMVGVARTLGIPLDYFADDLTRDEAEAILDEVEERPRRITAEEKIRWETADTLALLSTRASRMDSEQISVLRTLVDQAMIALDLPPGWQDDLT